MASVSDLHDAVFDAVSVSLGLTETQANKMLRYSMPNGESLPFEELCPDENRCYIRLADSVLGGVGARERKYKNTPLIGTKTDKTIQVLTGVTASLVFYGEQAVENANTTYAMISEDEPREILQKVNLAVVGGGSMPVYFPELVNGRWINRCDLEIRMYRLVEYEKTVEAFTLIGMPTIIIKGDN